jgi:hypothetical protein
VVFTRDFAEGHKHPKCPYHAHSHLGAEGKCRLSLRSVAAILPHADLAGSQKKVRSTQKYKSAMLVAN